VLTAYTYPLDVQSTSGAYSQHLHFKQNINKK